MRKKKVNIVDSIMESIEEYLTEKYGKIEPQWELTLFLLRDNIEQYLEYKKVLKETGVFDKDTYKKNPLISSLKDLNASILKYVAQLGISPYSSTKIGNLADDTSDGDLLKNLMLLEDNDNE